MSRLDELKDRVRINGFRPGKVPVAHLKRMYGRSAMAEVIEATVRDTNNQIVSERGYKLAADPKVTLPTEQAEVEKLIAGESDLDYTDGGRDRAADRTRRFQDHQADQAHQRRHRHRSRRGARPHRRAEQALSAAKPEGEKAAKDDRVTISFAGTIDGVAVRRRHRRRCRRADRLEHLHSRLRGSTHRHRRRRNPHAESDVPASTTGRKRLAGKNAEFVVTAKSIEAPGTVTIDDEFAKSLGLESLAKLRDAVKERIAHEHAGMSRQKLKRALLDELDKQPQIRAAAVAGRGRIRPRLEVGARARLETEKKTFADEGTTEEKAKAEYRAIAERRVRLGLVLAEIGEKNNITVTEEELNRAVMEQVRQFPGQEQQVWDYYRQNPQAIAALARADLRGKGGRLPARTRRA